MNKGLHLCLLWMCVTLVSAHGIFAQTARAEAGGLIPMVLCAGEATETVWIDANGDPVTPQRDCIKCKHCIGGLDLAPARDMPGLTTAPFRMIPVNWSANTQASPSNQVQIPMPRGPPAKIEEMNCPGARGDAARLVTPISPTTHDVRSPNPFIGSTQDQERR